ncbi:MAG: alkaline phosphatase PhoX [Bacteroidota bacterium]
MKQFRLLLFMLVLAPFTSFSQFFFDVSVDTSWNPLEVVFPPSPLQHQILFVGADDVVQTTATYGNAPGQALAKQWHDFIGFTPDEESDDLGWISVNHEMIIANDSIGDGGGMTAFKVRRDPITDLLEIVPQTLSDGRSGEFFNVDFVNTVGETGMNCGGITSSVDGRIWTAEEWFRSSNGSLGGQVRDLDPWTINTDIPGNFAGQTIEKFENFNYMVEIDPKEAVAVRKQYNWGRQPFEGGAIAADNRTVYLGADATPGIFSRFVADTPGDFRSGKLYAYKHDAEGEPWVEISSTDLETALNYTDEALAAGATMFNRLEWVTYHDGKVYMTETGRDNIGTRLSGGAEKGGILDYHWIEPVRARHPELAEKTDDQVLDFVLAGFYNDYYGRVLEFDPATGLVTTYLNGGPFYASSPEINEYPEQHLSNPDGLNVLVTNGKAYMLIAEDLNGTSNGRTPAGISNRTCELYLLDMSLEDPTLDDMVRISIVPLGAEMTGVQPTPDGKTILANSQHPSSSNPYPYNNSLTFAITGWDEAITAITSLEGIENQLEESLEFQVWPNPVSRQLNFNQVIDAALYDNSGKRIKVFRAQKSLDVSDIKAGVYFLKTDSGKGRKLIIQ